MITVWSTRGGVAQVGTFLPATVSEIASMAAADLGYAARGHYTLADQNYVVLDPDDQAPTDGVYHLVDRGGDV